MLRPIALLALVVLVSAARTGKGAESPTLWTAADLPWAEVPGLPGARQARLWGESGADQGTLIRWKANTKAPAVARAHDQHVVVIAGTFTIDIEGTYREFGPRSFIRVPGGATHAMGCEAAGECIFVIHDPGPVPAAK